MDSNPQIDVGKDFGTCEFCGQLVIIREKEKPPFHSCDCWKAKQEVTMLDKIKKGRENVEELFGDQCEQYGFTPLSVDVIDMANTCLERVVRGEIETVSFGMGNKGSGKIKINSKGKLKIERSHSTGYAVEV